MSGGLRSVQRAGGRRAGLRTAKQEHDELAGWLSHMRSPPVAPPLREDPWSIDGLKSELDFARAYAAERARISALPVVDFDVEAVALSASYGLWSRARAVSSSIHGPPIAASKWSSWVARGKHTQYQPLDELHPTWSGEQACCPVAATVPARPCYDHGIRVQMADWVLRSSPPSTGAVSDLQAERRIADWAIPRCRRPGCASAPPRDIPHAGRQPPATGEGPLERPRLVHREGAMLAALQPPEREEAEVRQLLAALRKWEALDNAYQNELPIYAAWRVEYDFKRARQIELAASVAKLPEVEAAWRAALAFEAERATYERDLALYTTLVAELVEKRAEVEGWRAAKASLIDLRLRIKTYLVPSLSKVASHLLSQMTDGQRSSIVVNENFDIMVDGQRLETLSGSGKACANLALRIGLGQVLTNKVVSLFVGDEIDAAMDTARATSTHSSIRMLSSQISQILLITHTLPVADTIVVLGAGADEQEADGIVRGL